MLVVTGGTGHSGLIFLEKLSGKGYREPIRVLVRKESDVNRLAALSLNLEIRITDLNDTEDLKSAFVGATTILHIASITLSPKIVEAAIALHVDWIILIHTTGRYSRFKSAASGYIEIEDALLQRKNEINMTILRPTMIYGSMRDKNISNLISYIDSHKFFPVFGSGNNLMQPVTGEDLAVAYLNILENPAKTKNKEYNLSGKEPIRYADMLKLVSKKLGKATIFVHIPLRFSIFLAKVYNALFKKAIITVEQVQRMQEDKVFSHTEATQDFGYHPLSFEEGITIEIEEYKNRRM